MDATFPILILAIPLCMFLFLGLLGKFLSPKTAGILGTVAMGVTTALAYYTAYTYFFSGAECFQDGDQRLQHIVFNPVWLEFYGNLHINIGFLLDPISAMMLVVITTISFMVNLYSNAYMRDHHGVYEKGFQRYYAFLALFSFSMLGLVVATNIFQMYIFWELVGASSYLLIGFYYTSPAAVSASKKAFIVTRFADLGFLIGILVLSYYTGVFNFMDFTSVPVEGIADTYKVSLDTAANVLTQKFAGSAAPIFMGGSVLTWALVLIFMGGMGKSAMLPLHIWLPDAMEGPTPVSALIHAATMVVAGVYLVARLFPLYLQEVTALEIVTVVGAITAFYAAMVACAQVDIKRVLAFSTISQIAFMMVSLGVCRPELHGGIGYMASMFHLFTPALFKALLFLGAGALIHAVHSNNYTAMHGLRKYMPVTHWTFLIGCLAIAGIIPFSGFFSKDEILTACGEYSTLVYIWMSLVAALTAFYMFRLYFLIFWWKEHKVHDPHHAPHDQPWPMTVPLIILALVSCVAGFIPFGDFVTFNGHNHEFALDWTVAGISLAVAVISIAVAAKMYMKENPLPDKLAASMPRLWDWCHHRFYWDELYMFITHRIIFGLICKPIAWFDRHIIDGTMDAFATVTNKASCAIKGIQSGNVQTYVWIYLLGALALAAVTYLCLI